MLRKDNCKPSREAFELLELVPLMLDILRYIACWMDICVGALLTMTGHRNELLLRGCRYNHGLRSLTASVSGVVSPIYHPAVPPDKTLVVMKQTAVRLSIHATGIRDYHTCIAMLFHQVAICLQNITWITVKPPI